MDKAASVKKKTIQQIKIEIVADVYTDGSIVEWNAAKAEQLDVELKRSLTAYLGQPVLEVSVKI